MTTPKKDCYAEKVAPHLDDIRRYVSHGVTEKQLCEFYGVGRTVWADYKKKYPELTETLSRARVICKTELVNRAYMVAIGYEYEETTTVTYTDEKGKVTGGKTTTVTKYSKADANMLQFLLINRYHDEFARDPQILEIRRELLKLKEQVANGGGKTEGV